MVTREGQLIATEVSCKTWGCVECRDRKLAEVKRRMWYGCSILGSCYLITLTYRAVNGETPRNADGARKVWRAWLQRLNNKFPKVAWFRIVELTKMGIPHYHLLVGGLETLMPRECRTLKKDLWKESGCDCLTHWVARSWYESTGDSYIVDVRHVVGPSGISNYLGKYLIKSMGEGQRERLEALGYPRRFSRSDNWPSDKLQSRGTAEGGWSAAVYERRHGPKEEYLSKLATESEGDYLLERVGPELLLKAEAKLKKRYSMGVLKGVNREPNHIRETREIAPGGGGDGRSDIRLSSS